MKNKIYIVCFILFITLMSCKSQDLNYYVSEKYSGPCIVFIYEKKFEKKENNCIINSEGFGTINKSNMKDKFLFISQENNTLIEVVFFGEEKLVNETERRIFGLGQSQSSSTCNNNSDIFYVEFFIGTKKQFLEWSNKYDGAMDYFKKSNPKWCDFYKAGLKE